MSNKIFGISYFLERWRAESLFGLKKIVWLFIVITLILLLPSYWVGKFVGNNMTPTKSAIDTVNLSLDAPDYTIQDNTTVTYEDGSRGYYARINNKNSNTNTGYMPWIYSYSIYDSTGKKITDGNVTTYLAPNSEMYIIGPITREAGLKFEINTDAANSKIVKYDKPSILAGIQSNIKVTNVQSPEERTDDPNLINIAFTVANNSNYNIKKVELVFNIKNKDQKIIGIGKYTVSDFAAGTQRDINLTHPKPRQGTNLVVEVIPYVNYMDSNNLQIVY